ncbi:MAG TPA: DUF1573 domain-containing protein [Cytophagaceae bacterium]|jgi:hypothetical protein|nr:DUF1573 domain-containing protein [Cytophagaceae bacterium]
MLTRIIIAALFFLTGPLSVVAQADRKAAHIVFAESMKDYGDISYGDSISYVFTFTNTGSEDLIIKNVVTTCSCTSRKYTEGPIAPGKTGELTVSFNSGKQDKLGRQNKVITVLSNADNNPERVILVCTILEKRE